jgi:hypothetical protein
LPHPTTTLIISHPPQKQNTNIFIGVLLVVPLDALVQQGVQYNQERHVDHKNGDDPNDDNHNNFDDASVSVLIFALTPGAELLFFALQFSADFWKDDAVTVAAESTNYNKEKQDLLGTIFLGGHC